jgi:hypothetical protein
MVWSDGFGDGSTDDEDNDDELDRLYTFEVEKTNEQEENVTTRARFTVCHHQLSSIAAFEHPTQVNPGSIVINEAAPESSGDHVFLMPRLVAGETMQAFMTTKYIQPSQHIKQILTTYNSFQLESHLCGLSFL